MSDYKTHAIQILRNNMFRITAPRQHVIDALDRATTPMSPYDIVDWLKGDGLKMDTVTVYRIFECLEANGLIHRVLSTGKYVKCGISPTAQHSHSECCHHLAICDRCGATREIHCHAPINIPDLPDMMIIGHRLELIGRCTQCQSD